MRRALFGWELRKLWSMPAFGAFLLLCLTFNALRLADSRIYPEYVSYVSSVALETGGQMGGAFDQALAAMPEAAHKQALVAVTQGAADIFEGYDAMGLCDLVAGVYGITDEAGQAMLRWKYERLQGAADALAAGDVSLSLNAGELTYDLMESLFSTLCRCVLTEGWLIAALTALYLCCCERLTGTQAIYAARIGRRVQGIKLAAALASAMAAYLLLAALSLALFACLWDMRGIWGASMSSQFNFRLVGVYRVEFITWRPFTVAGYLLAQLGLGAVVTAVAGALAFCAGLAAGDMYKGFAAFISGGMLMLLIAVYGMEHLPYSVSCIFQWNPVMLWYNQHKWFTDMDFDSVLPWQECWEAALWLALSVLLIRLCRRRFQRKDVR